jgi:hypothetical protein
MLWSSFSRHYLTAATTYRDDNARVEQQEAGQITYPLIFPDQGVHPTELWYENDYVSGKC